MMPINPLGSKIPFVLIYFEVMNYPLSEFFGKDQPFYGFLHYGSKGEKIKYRKRGVFCSRLYYPASESYTQRALFFGRILIWRNPCI